MQHRLKRNDLFKWSSSFVERLSVLRREEEISEDKMVTESVAAAIREDYHASASRLILLDYDGTLIPFSDRPEKAVPDRELLMILSDLAGKEGSDIVIISGRNKGFLELYFKDIPLICIAEHGAWIKSRQDVWRPVVPLDTNWKNEIRPLLEVYCDQTPGAFIEEKDFSLAWHYRRSDAELASLRAMELKGNLLHLIANHNLGIMEGNKVLEIKSLEINKAKITSYLLSLNEYDFILGIGDDVTDEDIFAAISDRGYSVKVGYGSSKAGYHVDGIASVRGLLRQLLD